MRCAWDHSCDRIAQFPYENCANVPYTHELAAMRTRLCDAVGMSSLRQSGGVLIFWFSSQPVS